VVGVEALEDVFWDLSTAAIQRRNDGPNTTVGPSW
jgi:hypothetical protein